MATGINTMAGRAAEGVWRMGEIGDFWDWTILLTMGWLQVLTFCSNKSGVRFKRHRLSIQTVSQLALTAAVLWAWPWKPHTYLGFKEIQHNFANTRVLRQMWAKDESRKWCIETYMDRLDLQDFQSTCSALMCPFSWRWHPCFSQCTKLDMR